MYKATLKNHYERPKPPKRDPRTVCGCGDYKESRAFGCGPSGCRNVPC